MFYKKTKLKTVDGSNIVLFQETLSSYDDMSKYHAICEEYINSAISYDVSYDGSADSDSISIESVWADKSTYDEADIKCESKQLELFNNSYQQYYEDADKFILDIETIDNYEQE